MWDNFQSCVLKMEIQLILMEDKTVKLMVLFGSIDYYVTAIDKDRIEVRGCEFKFVCGERTDWKNEKKRERKIF